MIRTTAFAEAANEVDYRKQARRDFAWYARMSEAELQRLWCAWQIERFSYHGDKRHYVTKFISDYRNNHGGQLPKCREVVRAVPLASRKYADLLLRQARTR